MRVNAPKAEDLTGGGTFLKTPGKYHMLIQAINSGVGPKGNPVDGFTAECKIMHGVAVDNSNQIGKEISLTFFAPNLNAKPEAQKNNERQNTAFFIATNVLQPVDLGKDDLELDENLANGAQFVINMAVGQVQQGNDWVDDPSKPLRIHFSDIWHVDDPEVASIPKDAEAIALIEPKDRHNAEWFAWKKKGVKASTSKPANAAAAANMGDIF